MTNSSAGVRATRVGGRFRQPDEYGLALVLILATIVSIALVGDQPVGQLVAAVLSGGTLLFILQTSQAPRRTMRVATVIVMFALLGTTVGIFLQNGFVDGTAYGLMIGFIEVAAVVIGLPRWSEALVFMVLIIVLVMRPSGLLGVPLGERA